MVDINEHLISSSEEVNYANLEISHQIEIAPVYIENVQSESSEITFEYSWQCDDFYSADYQENVQGTCQVCFKCQNLSFKWLGHFSCTFWFQNIQVHVLVIFGGKIQIG